MNNIVALTLTVLLCLAVRSDVLLSSNVMGSHIHILVGTKTYAYVVLNVQQGNNYQLSHDDPKANFFAQLYGKILADLISTAGYNSKVTTKCLEFKNRKNNRLNVCLSRLVTRPRSLVFFGFSKFKN